MKGFPNTLFSRNSFIVLALVATAAVIPHSFPLSSVSMARELLVIDNDQVPCSLCDNPCPPLLPPPPVIECPPPIPPPPLLSQPPPLPLPPQLSLPPPALSPLLPPPLTENCPPPPVPPICGACNSPPTGDIGQRMPPPPPALPPTTTCAMCESPPSGGIIYGSPPPPTMYPGYSGGGDEFYPPRPNIVTPYFPYDVPPRTASTGRSTPLFVYFWTAVLLALHFIM